MEAFAIPKLMRYFEEISAIPRGSYHEEKIADYLVAFAKERALDCYRDEMGNVLIKAGATQGLEDRAPVLLQGHTDMVCEKNEGVEHDFLRDPLKLYEKDGWLSAEGTTLGADNGVAVAMMLAILDGEAHPPLECLFTVCEEVGLDGAKQFDYSRISSRRMINLDGAGETELIVGCAGGVRSDLFLQGNRESQPKPCARISVRGLAGGHSGEDIHRGRANANCLMGQILQVLWHEDPSLRLVSLRGGDKGNAIPREAEAILSVLDLQSLKNRVSATWQRLYDELGADDENASAMVELLSVEEIPFDAKTTEKGIRLLCSMPNGVLAMEPSLPDLVQFSRNLGVVSTKEDQIKIVFSSRSAKEEQLDQSIEALNRLAEQMDLSIQHRSRYPGWEVASVSALREEYCKVFRRLFDTELRVVSIHAGLECGIIKAAVPSMDMLSCGPVIESLHSPDERLNLASFERFYRCLTEFLRQ